MIVKYAIWPTRPGKATYYQQTKDENGQVTTEKMEGDGLLEEVWDPFMEYREDNLNELAGKSYGGEITAVYLYNEYLVE